MNWPSAKGRPLVKICGLTRREDAGSALSYGAAFLGLILTRKSPRYLPLVRARELVECVRLVSPEARFVGVFVDEPAAAIAGAVEVLDLFAVQVHGDVERLDKMVPREKIIPSMGIKDAAAGARLGELPMDYGAVLADAFSEKQAGGTGKVFEHQFVQPIFERRRVFLAGGLKPENIEGVLEKLDPGPYPYVVDLSSGVEESPGVKSPEKMRDFFERYIRHFSGRRSS